MKKMSQTSVGLCACARWSVAHLVLLRVVHAGGEDGAQVSQVNHRQGAERDIDHIDPERLQEEEEETTHTHPPTHSFILFRDTNINGVPEKMDRLPSCSCVCSWVDISST